MDEIFPLFSDICMLNRDNSPRRRPGPDGRSVISKSYHPGLNGQGYFHPASGASLSCICLLCALSSTSVSLSGFFPFAFVFSTPSGMLV